MRNSFFLLLALLVLACTKDNVEVEGDSSEVIDENGFKGELAWIQNFGGSGDDTSKSIIETSDGGFAILGFTNSTDGDLSFRSLEVNDYWLLKFDSDATLQWQRTYGGSKDDRGQQVIQTTDGGYAITGYAMSDDGDGSNNEGFHDNWVLRLDVSGNILWEKSFGFSGHDHSYDILQTADGGFFFSGFLDVTSSNGEGATDKGSSLSAHGVGEFWGTKIDGNGNLEWRKYFGGSNNDRAYGVVNADDGGYVMAGFTESDDFDISNSKGSYDYWVVKIDKTGELVWESSFGGTGIDQAQDIAKTHDGGYVVVGSTFSSDTDITKNHGESDVWVVKLDHSGQMVWQKTFGGSQFDAAESISRAKDDGFLISGNSKSSDGDLVENQGENDIWLIKIDGEGRILWQKTVGGNSLDYGFDAIETENGNIMVVGETSSSNIETLFLDGSIDMVLMQFK